MAINPTLAPDKSSGTLFPVPQPGEVFILKRGNVEFQCKVQGDSASLKGKGFAILSSKRVVFVCQKKPSRRDFESFEIPLARLRNPHVKQPIFGVCALVGEVQPSFSHASLPSQKSAMSISLKFSSGGYGTFVPLLLQLMAEIQESQDNAYEEASKIIPAAQDGTLAKVASTDPGDPSVLYLTQPELLLDAEAQSQFTASGERGKALEAIMAQLSEQCLHNGYVGGREAFRVAIENLRIASPPMQPPTDQSELPQFVLRQRRAWRMCNALENIASSGNIMVALRLLHVCLMALSQVLNMCTRSLQQLESFSSNQEERQSAIEADAFQAFLRGLGSLRRLAWRFSLLADLLLPRADAGDAGGVESYVDSELHRLQAGASMGYARIKAAWAEVEFKLVGLGLDRSIGRWEPAAHFELCNGCCPAGSHNHKQLGAEHSAWRWEEPPFLCALCLLPAPPPPDSGRWLPAEPAAASTTWRGRVWHTQCANFWIHHRMSSEVFLELGVADPFADTGDTGCNGQLVAESRSDAGSAQSKAHPSEFEDCGETDSDFLRMQPCEFRSEAKSCTKPKSGCAQSPVEKRSTIQASPDTLPQRTDY